MSTSIEAIIIGNEILSGRRQDTHLKTTITACETRGLRLNAVHYVGDEPVQLIRLFKQTLANESIVLSFGGIGATPDDRTRQAMAKALNVDLERHRQGYDLLREKFADDFTPQREQLIMFPQGASLIPNPINGVPGFSIRDHHFVPGFPSMATPMIAWVLDQYYANLQQQRQFVCFHALAPESQLIPLLEDMDSLFSSVSISCLPQSGSTHHYSAELGFEGKHEDIFAAKNHALNWLQAHKISVIDEDLN